MGDIAQEQIVAINKPRTRRRFSAEDKTTVILKGFKGQDSIAEICRSEGIAPPMYYRWSKDFIEAGKKQLEGGAKLETGKSEVSDLHFEISELKQALAEELLKVRRLERKYAAV